MLTLFYNIEAQEFLLQDLREKLQRIPECWAHFTHVLLTKVGWLEGMVHNSFKTS